MNAITETAIANATEISAQDPATVTMLMDAVKNNLSCKGRGTITYEFVALPKAEGGWGEFRRLDQIEGAIINSRAAYCGGVGYSRSADRHSETEVEIDLPVGTLNKTVKKNVGQGYGSEIDFYILTLAENGEGQWKHLGKGRSKKTATGWVSIVDIDGVRHEFG